MVTAWQLVLDFWFGAPTDAVYGQPRPEWFKKSDAFDHAVETHLGTFYQQAIARQLATWKQDPEGCLALLVLLDQVPRNLFRGDPRAFASDPQALTLAKKAIAQGFDLQRLPIQRLFFYLPFEHSEDIKDQEQSLRLFRKLTEEPTIPDDFYDYAQRHYDVVKQFGRFPHRNKILGRNSTPEEEQFLTLPGSSF